MSDEHPQVQPQLTQEELVAVRRFIKEEERMRWLWHTIRKTSAWVAAVIGSVILLWDQLVRILRGIVGVE